MPELLTLQDLANGHLDVKALGEAANGDEDTIVTTRTGNTYPSAERAINIMFKNGGLPAKPFATKALMMASALVDGDYALVTDDTDESNGLYHKETGTWVNSEYDPILLANKYTDSLLVYGADDKTTVDTSSNIYVKGNDLDGLYVNINTSKITAATGVKMGFLTVKGGESYTFNTITGSAALIAFAKNVTLTEDRPVVLATLDNTHAPLVKVVIPQGVTHLLFNTKIPSLDYDVTESLVINKHQGKLLSVSGAAIPNPNDFFKKAEATYNSGAKNLATNGITGIYLKVPGSGSPNSIESTPTGEVQVFPASSGLMHSVYSDRYDPDLFNICAANDDSTTEFRVLTPITLTATENPKIKTFVMPTGLTHVFATTRIGSLGFDIRDSFWVNEGATSSKLMENQMISLGDKAFYDISAHSRLNTLAAVAVSRLKGKTWVAVGDSITEFNMRATKNYHDFVSEDVGGMVVINKGLSGSGFHDRPDVADEITTDSPDLITIMWGTNDFGLVRNNYPLGTFLSTDMETIAGRMKYAIEKLMNKYPLAKFAFISPPPSLTNYGSNADKNAQGYNLKDHVEMFERYAKHYSIPFLNLYEQSNLPVWIPAVNTYYFTAPTLSTPDGLHPNDAGQRIMADKIRPFLESI